MKSILFVFLLFSSWSLKAQTDTTQISKTDSTIYQNPEIAAMYPGGQISWMHFLQKNLIYPEQALPKQIQGTVVIRFWVDSAGLSHDVTAISGPEELRGESIKLINKVNMWSPAISYGKKVNAWKTQPITFRLQSQ